VSARRLVRARGVRGETISLLLMLLRLALLVALLGGIGYLAFTAAHIDLGAIGRIFGGAI
jgi:hypothetical protein